MFNYYNHSAYNSHLIESHIESILFLNSNCFQIHGPYFIYMYLNNKAIIDINYNQKYITGDVLNIYKLRFQFFNNSNFFVLNNIKSEYKTEIQKLLEQKFNNKLYFEK